MAYKIKGIAHAAILYSGAGVVSETDIPFGNTFTLAPEFDTITFEGDGTQEEEYINQRLTGTIGGDKFDDAVMARITGKTASTGVSGESKTFYMGSADDLTPPQIGLKVDLSAVDDNEAAATIRLTVFKAKVRPFTPPDAGNNSKWAPVTFAWTAERTTTNIAGEALTDVPTAGAMYSIGIAS